MLIWLHILKAASGKRMSLDRRVDALELKVGFLGEQFARIDESVTKHEELHKSDLREDSLTFWGKVAAFTMENRALLVLLAIPLLRALIDLINFVVGILQHIPKLPQLPHGGI